MTSDELKPCPKCKSSDVAIEIWPDNPLGPLRVGCKACQYSPDWWENTREEAVEYWNTRPIEDALRSEIELLVKAARYLLNNIYEFGAPTDSVIIEAVEDALSKVSHEQPQKS